VGLLKLGFEISERTVSRRAERDRGRDEEVQGGDASFAIDHDGRRIPHCNVTAHPTADWVVQRFREAFPGSPASDTPIRTSVRSPWQNGVAKRWAGSARRECFDRVIVLNEAHARRLARECMAYYHDGRTRDGLSKDKPAGRPVQPMPDRPELAALPRAGGFQHRYAWKTAA